MGPRFVFESIASTQERAVAEARAGAAPGTRFVARRQTAGRGRSGVGWTSPLGGLYLSQIVEAPTVARSFLPLAVGVELSAALGDRFGVPTRVKWPNDLLVVGAGRPRKLAGILCDAIEAPWGTAVVVGIGINVNAPPSSFSPELRPAIVGLSELTDRPAVLEDVESAAGTAIERAERGLRSEPGRLRLLRRCRDALYGLGRPARVDGRPVGVIRGLSEDGALLVGNGTAQTPVRAGSVLVEESA